MKSVFRFLLLLTFVMALALAPAFTASAQGDCLPGLSADDCALIAAAEANAATLTSFTIESFAFMLKVEGAPEGDVNVDVKGSGALDYSKVQVDPMKPESVFDGLLFAMLLDVAADASGQTENVALEVRLPGDGFVYFNVASMGAWQKVSLESAMQAGGTGGLPFDPSMFAEMGAGAADPAMAAALDAFAQIPGFISAEGLAGPTIDGVPTREIKVSVSLAALGEALSNDQLPDNLKSMLAMAGVDEMTLTQLKSFVTLLESTLKATTITFSQYLGTDDKMSHGVGLVIVTDIDPMVGSMLGLTSALKIDLRFDIKLSKLNQPVTVEPVADATDITNMLGGFN